MKLIKILKATVLTVDSEWDDNTTIIKDLTGWEEVDDDTFDKLQEYCQKKRTLATWNSKETYFFIVEDPNIKVITCLKEFEEMIDEEEAERRIKGEKRRKLMEKRKANKGAVQKAKDLKKLKELQEKYK